MKNYIQSGKALDLTAPVGGVTSGMALLIGALLVVPVADAAEGETFAGETMGVFELPKANQAFTEGAKLYWSTSNENLTTTASGNTLVGVAAAAAASGDTTAHVRLDGVAR